MLCIALEELGVSLGANGQAAKPEHLGFGQLHYQLKMGHALLL